MCACPCMKLNNVTVLIHLSISYVKLFLPLQQNSAKSSSKKKQKTTLTQLLLQDNMTLSVKMLHWPVTYIQHKFLEDYFVELVYNTNWSKSKKSVSWPVYINTSYLKHQSNCRSSDVWPHFLIFSVTWNSTGSLQAATDNTWSWYYLIPVESSWHKFL